MRAVTRSWVFALAAAALAGLPHAARSQGGPPMVTDDPDTPGDGHWENNLAIIATRSGGRWSLAVPDADLNYGWGERVQLNADLPLAIVQQPGGGWAAGPGSQQLAVKWRFADRQDLGYTLSTYPRFTSEWIASARRRGLALGSHEYFLPLEAATQIGDYGLDGEIGRDFAVGAASQWQLGAILAHACAGGVQCMFELRETLGGHEAQTLLNVGAHWKLNESLALIGAAGREFGRRSPDQQLALLYLGVQIVR